jgi:hypothetical protein
MAGQRDPLSTPVDVALRRLQLCAYAVQEIHTEVQEPTDPEHKADLLLATENLTYEVLDLLKTVKFYAWGPESYFQDEDEDEEV